MNDAIDTTTSEGFSAALDILKLSISRASLVLQAPESSVKQWLRATRPVHPAAASMLSWMLDGYRPDTWHLTGPGLRAMREDLGLSEDELAIILDAISTGRLDLWQKPFDGCSVATVRPNGLDRSPRPPWRHHVAQRNGVEPTRELETDAHEIEALPPEFVISSRVDDLAERRIP